MFGKGFYRKASSRSAGRPSSSSSWCLGQGRLYATVWAMGCEESHSSRREPAIVEDLDDDRPMAFPMRDPML